LGSAINSQGSNFFRLANSTVHGNYGGGITMNFINDQVLLSNNTIAHNIASNGSAGIFRISGDIYLKSNLIAQNTDNAQIDNCDGTNFNTLGNSIVT
jgi:hypothetical protein